MEAASTTPFEYLERVLKSGIIAGADVINVPDTVGERRPLWMYDFYKKVIRWCIETNPDVTISAHNHNDIGMAVANTEMLLEAAIEVARTTGQSIKIQNETTVCGLGERAGNADVYPVVAGLYKFTTEFPDVDVAWRFNPGESVSIADAVMSCFRMEVDRQNPIVGRDINVHRSGIHSHGVVNGGYTLYTPITPTFWGHREDAKHETGEYQGRVGNAAAEGRI